jgi:hypothetical protein
MKVYIFFLVRVLPILIVPIIVMTAIYCWSIEVIKQQTYEKNLAVMKSSAETIKKTFDNMNNLITYINGSPSINRLFTTVNPVLDGSTTSDLLSIQQELKALTTANGLIENIQIFSVKHNILIDSVTNAIFSTGITHPILLLKICPLMIGITISFYSRITMISIRALK